MTNRKTKRTSKQPAFQPDIEFSGLGIYTVFADTPLGEDFLTEYVLFAPWQGNPRDGIAIDGGSMAQDIAGGAIENGLQVAVNGKPYRTIDQAA